MKTTPSENLAIEGFLAPYKSNTRQGYEIALNQWKDWCDLHKVALFKVKRVHIETWIKHLRDDLGRKPQTVGSKLNAVCGLYKYAFLEQLISSNPAAHVRRPKIEFKSTTNGLTRTEFKDVLMAAKAEGCMVEALICLLGLNGLRIGECLNVNVEDIQQENGYTTVKLHNRKGGKVGVLSLAIPTAWAVKGAIGDRTAGPLLLGLDGNRMSCGSARRTVRRLARTTKIDKRLSPHSFRKTMITMALDAGVPERDIIDSTGHESYSMLSYYDGNRGGIERNATHAIAAYVGAVA